MPLYPDIPQMTRIGVNATILPVMTHSTPSFPTLELVLVCRLSISRKISTQVTAAAAEPIKAHVASSRDKLSNAN